MNIIYSHSPPINFTLLSIMLPSVRTDRIRIDPAKWRSGERKPRNESKDGNGRFLRGIVGMIVIIVINWIEHYVGDYLVYHSGISTRHNIPLLYYLQYYPRDSPP
jgi:hypothetical protein